MTTDPALVAEPLRLFLSTTALFLIIGGLAILFLIVGLFLIQSLVPRSQVEPLPAGKGKRRLRPVDARTPPSPSLSAPGAMNYRLWRRRIQDESPLPRIDIALDRLVAESLGEPRILRRLSNGFHLRLLNCRECGTIGHGASFHASCTEGRSRMLEACRAVFGTDASVKEIGCRLQGHVACDFEVTV